MTHLNTNQYNTQHFFTLIRPYQYVKNGQLFTLIDHITRDIFLRWCFYFCSFLYHKTTSRKFTFNNTSLTYCTNNYNHTWGCERAIEIAIARQFLRSNKQTRILEVGCVLPHYQSANWDVLDKFEQGNNIINQDILDYKAVKKYNTIVCISTIEHIGIDDSKKDTSLSIKTIESLKKLLSKKGKLFITFPFGYHKVLDKYVLSHKNVFTHSAAMVRISPWNTWKQVPLSQLKNKKYGWPYNNANGIFIGEYLQR